MSKFFKPVFDYKLSFDPNKGDKYTIKVVYTVAMDQQGRIGAQHQVKLPSLDAGHPYTPTSFIRKESCCGWQDTERWTNVPLERSLA